MLSALTVVASDAVTNVAIREDAAERIIEHALAGFNNRLSARRVLWELRPEDRDKIVNDAIVATVMTDPDQLAGTARFLVQCNASDRMAELLDLQKAKQRRDYALIWLDALAKLNHWDEIEKALKEENLPLEPFFKQLFLFRINVDQERMDEADALWEVIVAPGPDLADRLRTAADYALKLRRFDYARKAYATMSQNSQIPRASFIGMINVAKGEDKLDEVIMLLSIMVEQVPGDKGAANDFNYYRLLKNINIQSVIADTVKLYRTDRSVMSFRITYAMAFLRSNQPEDAYTLLSTNGLKWEEFTNDRKVVRMAALIRTGRSAEAQTLLDTLNPSELLQEERELLQPLLN